MCFICGNESYKNPIPIVVSLIRTENDECKHGLLIQRRNIEPKKGEWALPGGYIEFGETWQEAAARENMEEMGMKSSPEDYEILDIRKPGSGNMLIFCLYEKWECAEELMVRFVPNSEVLELRAYYGDMDLAFPAHNEMAKQFMKEMKDGKR
jgi:ADP-ribose pyrophosphatase YjhB (NUDIX family)